MWRLLGSFLFVFLHGFVFAQTCTIVDPDGNPLTSTLVGWIGVPTKTCSETGLAPQPGDKLIVPKGVSLSLENSGSIPTSPVAFHVGNMEIYGYVTNNKSQAQIDGSVTIKNGGVLQLNKIMYFGDASDSPCPYNLIIDAGGLINLAGGGASDRIVICGNIIAQSSGGCNPYPAGPIPYCEPPEGFTGPIILNETGLPVELLYFTAKAIEKKIALSWATSSEQNFDHFDIEKSVDGKSFHSIAKINGHGTTKELQNYTLEDEKPFIGKNYYRLKSVDFDGFTEYFNVVMVDFDGSKNFSVSPNPSEGVSFTAETNFTPETRAFVVIYTTLGAEVGRYEVSGNKSLLTMPAKLESGVYYAKYISSDFTATNRVVVK